MSRDWRRVLISPQTNLQKTIEVIDDQALQVALVVDQKERLLGVVTDGDIRRALMKGFTLQHSVVDVMNKFPKVASVSDSKEHLIAIMEKHQLYHLPVLDNQGSIVALKTLRALYKQPEFENPVFLMAGGMGLRLRPLTNSCPKPLLEIGGKPILETIIENFVKAGFKNFYIAVNYLADQIQDYFGDGSAWGAKIKYVHEDEPLGTAGALGLLEDSLPDLPVLVMNGDILTQIDFLHLLEYHNQQGGVATLCVREHEYQIPYGVVSIEHGSISGIVEKPIHKCFFSAGIYVLNYSLISEIKSQKRLDMPDFLNFQITTGALVSMFPVHEYWLDIGREADFLRAQGEFSRYF